MASARVRDLMGPQAGVSAPATPSFAANALTNEEFDPSMVDVDEDMADQWAMRLSHDKKQEPSSPRQSPVKPRGTPHRSRSQSSIRQIADVSAEVQFDAIMFGT